MEPVGLAAGVVGLAGLFSSCLEAVERFDSWRSFEDDSRSLGARFEAEKLRLEKWGVAVGFFGRGAISRDHHEALDDPRIRSRVSKHLSIIENICSNGDDASLLVAGTDAGPAKHGLSRGHIQIQPSTLSKSRRQKVKWALRNKARCTAQVEGLGQLVQDLHNLVPPDGSKGTRAGHGRGGNNAPGHRDDALADREPWTAEFRRILARIEREFEGLFSTPIPRTPLTGAAETRKDLHTWLLGRHVPNEVFDSAVQRRLDGTCDWILQRPLFLDWASADFPAGSAKLLWINGPAGFGKTVLCARVVEYLSSTLDQPTAHFFFSSDFESRRDPFVTIRSWLSQLLSHPAAFELVYQRWEAQHSQVATRADVVSVFREIVHAIPGCTFVMDGLDECTWAGEDWTVDDSSSVAHFLEMIQQAVADTTTRIVVVSRDEPDIRQGMVQHTGVTIFECKITPEDVQLDTELYSRSIVDKRLSNKDETIKDDISQRLAGRCHGQFLWLKMQEPSLRGGKNRKQLEAAIDTTPTGLDRLYDRNWEKILGLPDKERTRAVSLLRLAAFAVRPLTVSEITEALLIDDNCDDLPVDEMPDSIDKEYIDSEILGLCGSLVEIQSVASESNVGLGTVHLTHFSVKQYFIYRMSDKASVLVTNERLRCSNEAIQNNVLAAMCLRYVNFRSVWKAPSKVTNLALGSFRDYAAGSWCQHATVSKPIAPGIVRLTNELFDTNNQNWHSWRKWFDSNDGESEGQVANESSAAGPLYYASALLIVRTICIISADCRSGKEIN